MGISMCACGSPACKHCNPNIWTGVPENTHGPNPFIQRIAELEAKVERLKKALEETPCSCIGPRPCRKEGTKCSRCVALESKMEKGE